VHNLKFASLSFLNCLRELYNFLAIKMSSSEIEDVLVRWVALTLFHNLTKSSSVLISSQSSASLTAAEANHYMGEHLRSRSSYFGIFACNNLLLLFIIFHYLVHF
jgi:hypothetical protein